MSDLRFRSSEIRLATAALASIAALIPALYLLWPLTKQASSEHVKTFNKLLQSYTTLRPQALTANASRDFSHTVLPAALNIPSRNLQPFQQHATQIFSLFSDFHMIPQTNRIGNAVHFSKETDTVIAHCKMGGRVNGESEMGAKLVQSGLEEWWTECVLFVRMSGDGKRVVEVREFVNSARAEELKRRLTGVFE
jgi:hypothetical protein